MDSNEVIENVVEAVITGRSDVVRTVLSTLEQNGILKDENNASESLLNRHITKYGTLLHAATKLGHVDIMRMLLTSGADPGIKNESGKTAVDLSEGESSYVVFTDELFKASAQSKMDQIKVLLNSGVSVNSVDCPSSGNTPLHWAACFGSLDTVICLMENGADLNKGNAQGVTPLHEAVTRGDSEIVKALLKAGANPEIKASGGGTKGKSSLELLESNSEINVLFDHQENDRVVKEKDHFIDNSLDSLSSGSHDMIDLNMGHLTLATDDPVKELLLTPSAESNQTFQKLMTPLPLVTDSKLHILWPQPVSLVQTDGEFLSNGELIVSIYISSSNVQLYDVLRLWEVYVKKFKTIHYRTTLETMHTFDPSNSSSNVFCIINDSLFSKQQSYKLIITQDQIKILASCMHGLHYCLCTLFQILSLYSLDEPIPTLAISDYPTFKHRGVLLDLSSESRIPTFETLCGFIEVLSYLKCNEFYLYIKFAKDSSSLLPYTTKELQSLNSFCKDRFIRVVPVVDVNSDIAFDQLPDFYHPVQQFLSSFLSLNLVCLGTNFSYLLLANSFCDIWKILPLPHSSVLCLTVSSVADVNLQSLSPAVMTVLKSEPLYADVNSQCLKLNQMGQSVFLCFGTGCANTISGSPDAIMLNIYEASQAGVTNNSLGLILGHWSGCPPQAALSLSWLSVIVSSGLSWNSSTRLSFLQNNIADLLSYHVFQDSENVLGQIVVELGLTEAYVHASATEQQDMPFTERSILHKLLVDPDSVNLDGLSLEIVQNAMKRIKQCQLQLHKSKVECFQSGEVLTEIKLTIYLLTYACRLVRLLLFQGCNPDSSSMGLAFINVGLANLSPTTKTDLANKLLGVIEQFRAAWLVRNIPPGLHSSLLLFNSLLKQLIPHDITHTSIENCDT